MTQETSKRVAIIGLGGGGGRIAAELAADASLGRTVEIAAADTDRKALDHLQGLIQIPLGPNWTKDSGCGGNSTMGEKAAAASLADLTQFVDNAAMVIVAAGLGGGTGAGAARVLARQLRLMNIPSLFLAGLPFAFEGNWRCHQAEKDLEALRALTDAVLAIPNDLLFSALPADTPATRAFEIANTVLAQGLNGLACIPHADALLSVDFAAVCNLLKDRPGLCSLGVGRGAGPERWHEVIRSFFDCPFVGGPDNLAKADAAVLTLIGGQGLSVGEMQSCLAAIQQRFPPTSRLLVGAFTDERFQDEIRLTGLICRFGAETRATGRNRPAHELAAKTAGAADPATPKRAKSGREVQGELLLQEQALGIFANCPPTTVRGENLDIPTFQRRSIQLDPGT